MNHLADRVRWERLRRKLSVRDAATLGKISNTWWGRFEDGVQPMTEGIEAAVAKAFDWPQDWASQPDEYVELRDQVAALRRAVRELLGRANLDVEVWLPEPPAASAAER